MIITINMHAFVAMPYNIKEGIDFNSVYEDFIKPALVHAGFEVFRADEELSAGNIRTDMFQELLLADLVVADLSIDNPNVWYELGVRHALRSRGVVQVKCKRDRMPFDVYTDRSLTYHIKDGMPDPEFLDGDKESLSAMCLSTVSSWYGRKVSPVYHLLGYLQEPNWKSLRIDEAKEFWEKQEKWEQLINIAQKQHRPGDILVLADEAPNQALRMEAHRIAGKALLRLNQLSLALEQIEKCIAIDPSDLDSLQYKGLILNKLKKYDAAREWMKLVSQNNSQNSDTWALLGCIEKGDWINSWRRENKASTQMKEDAADQEALLNEAIEPFIEGFLLDSSNYYSGINALILLHISYFLTGNEEQTRRRHLLEGGVRWAIESALSKETPTLKDFKARKALAEFEILKSDESKVEKAYKFAVAALQKDWNELDSSIEHLLVLQDLGFRYAHVSKALKILKQYRQNLSSEKLRTPNRVFLFSGHRIDEPNRTKPRFPADKEGIAAKEISSKLDELKADEDDLGLCGGACGGDLLFAEECLLRGVNVELRIPFSEPKFVNESVAYAGDIWRDRYYKIKNHSNTKLYVMPEELPMAPRETNAYSRNNLWQLYTALAWTPEKVNFICLWNKEEGDGPGGTKHMLGEVVKHFGHVHILDTNKLFG